MSDAPCTLPPSGWTCGRPAGHDGPCAARLVQAPGGAYPETLPWWRSGVIVGAALSAVFKLVFALLVLFGHPVEYSADELQPVIDALVLLVSFVGDFIAARARVTQKAAPPVTLRKEP